MAANSEKVRRNIRNRLLWPLVLLLVVSLPVLLFAMVGLPHVFRGAQVRDVVALEAGGQAPGVASAHFVPAFALLAGTPLTAGNAVEVLANGDDTFPRLWRDLRSARRSITVQMYYAGPGRVANRVSHLLIERARAGVDVFFLHDAFGTQDLPPRYFEQLRAGGVHVAVFRPVRWYTLDRSNHRLHVRGIVIDGATAYTGGFGFDDQWLGDGTRPQQWRETNVRFAGPAVEQLQAAFIANWAEATGQLLTGERLLPPHGVAVIGSGSASGSASAGTESHAALVNSPPLEGSTTAERLIAFSIASARQRLYIANAYFVPDPDFVQLLVDSAARGVDVRLLTGGAYTDVRATRLAARSRYAVLLAAGVRIYEYRPTNMHAKTFVVDGKWTVIGTMNFDNRSMAYNNEVALVVLDDRVGASMESLFLDDLRRADEIRPGEFSRRSRAQRFLERAANLVASLL